MGIGLTIRRVMSLVVVAALLAGAAGMWTGRVALAAPPLPAPAAPDAGGETCQVLQPNASSGKDAYIKQEKPDERRGNDGELRVKSEANKLMRSLLQFDLSGLPTGATITSATLSLYVKGASGGAVVINAHRITASWNEAEVTWKARDKAANLLWATQGGDYDPAVAASASVDDTKNVWRSWDLTGLVSGWVANPASNFGLILEASGGKAEKIFKSSDDGTASQRPKLEVCYTSGVTVEPDNSGEGVPGLTKTYAHTVTVGSTTQAVNLSAVSSMGWTTRIRKDVNGNGQQDPGDDVITQTPVLTNASYPILVQIDVPFSAVAGMVDTTTVTATGATTGASDTATDRTQIGKQILVQPDNSNYATAGSVLFYGHQIINNGDAQDCMTVTASSNQGWTVLLWQDLNANGVHETSSPNEPPLSNPVCIAPGGVYHLVAEVQVPAGATAGTVDKTVITATSGNSAGISDTAVDTTQVFVNAPPVVDGQYDDIYRISPDSTNVCYTSGGVLFGKLSSFSQPSGDSVYVVLAIDKDFVDNTYGTNAIGWPGGHTFGNLTGSDHAQFYGFNASGTKVLDFKIDYLSSASGTPSGYASLGVNGGDGKMNLGSASSILAWGTSLEYSLNSTGYCSAGNCSALGTNLLVNSPATDAFYTPNPTYPNWIFDVIYEVQIAKSAFGAGGFGRIEIPYIHASPSKTGTNSIYAEPGPCPGEIGDTVWNDTNANGIQDPGEPGINGVQVRLYRDNGDGVFDAATDQLLGTRTTSSGGKYLFQDLLAGDYFVDVVDATVPAGYSITTYNDPTPVINLGEGQSYLEADFGYATGAAIGDFVWDDLNKNGIQDAGEPGLPNVTVRLYDGAGNLLATTFTDDTGHYLFPNRPAGTYQIEFVAPFGYVFTLRDQGLNDAFDSDADPATGRTATFTTTGSPDLTRDAGLYYQAPGVCDTSTSISSSFNSTPIAAGNYIWFNSNFKASGIGSGPVTILLDSSTIQFTAGSTTYNLTVPRARITFSPTATQTTTSFDAATQTWVTTVSPGNFGKNVFSSGLAFLVPAGGLPANINPVIWNGRFTTDTPGVTLQWRWSAAVYSSFSTNYGALGVKPVDGNAENPYNNGDSAGTPENYKSFVVAGARGTGGSNYTGSWSAVGNVTPCQSALVGDLVWRDNNGNGIQNTGEPGVSGVPVNLYTSTGVLVGVTTTDANGLYEFKVPPGSYYVQFTPPAGHFFTLRDQGGDNAVDSDPNPTDGKTAIFALVYGQQDRTWDAGLLQGATLGDRVWLDANRDGIQDGDEVGVPNVTVKLFDSLGVLLATTATDADGLYRFVNLAPGSYSVQFVLPAGYVFTLQDQGGDDDLDSDANPVTGKTVLTSLASNEEDLSWDAGIYQVSALGDRVWLDDGDGIQEPGEPGVGNVDVYLFDAAANWLDSTTTDANGNYQFTHLLPGDYFLLFVPPSAYLFTPQYQGGDPTRDSDADPDTGETDIIPLAPGQSDMTRDAGLILGASIGDTVFYDDNRNGVQDGAEVGIQGVNVQLYRDGPGAGPCDDLVATMQTNADGLYLFEGLPAGHYCVQVPEGGVDNPVLTGFDRTAGGNPQEKDLVLGESYLDADFGYAGYGVIRGIVWYDWNENGVQDFNEPGMGGVTVCLYPDSNGDGVPDPGPALACTTTNPDGSYAFNDRLPGDYVLVQTQPGGLTSTTPDQLSVVLVLSQGTGFSDHNDFGEVVKVRFGDFVYFDINGNGVQDPGETAGITGVPLQVEGVDVIQQSVSASPVSASGNYLVSNQLPGTYTVTAPTNFGDWVLTSQPVLSTLLTITKTEDLTLDFGYDMPSSFAISKKLNTPSPVRVGEAISFTIRITNTGKSWIGVLPLRDLYNTTYLSFVSADPAPQDNLDDGQLDWNDLTASFGTDLAPGASFAVVVNFTAKKDTGDLETINRAIASGLLADPDGPGPMSPTKPLAEQEALDTVAIFNPTGAAVTGFVVRPEGDGLVLSWQTATEIHILGFNVLRLAADGSLTAVNAELIFAEHSGTNQGAQYQVVDAGTPARGSVTYILEVVRLDGSVEPYELRPPSSGR